jgi:arginyl-tRNA synthetase
MRNLCLGDALIKVHRYCGINTLSTTFPGDVGTHVAKCLWYLKFHNKTTAPEVRKGAWLGKMYTAANNLLEEQKGTDQEEKNREALTQILKEIEKGEGEYFNLWKETREWSIALMQEVYGWAGVTFDSWYWESDVDSSSVKLIQEHYDKGTFIKDDGAIGINLEDYKLGFCLLLKRDGTGLYATKDIELARRKFEDHNVDHSLYVVDNRQSLHFKQVFKTLEIMGFDKAKDCHHLPYEMVELQDGAMSSRKGNIVALQDLIDQMVKKIKEDYLAKYNDEWSTDDISETANIIAAGAIKYGMNKVDPNKKIIFDMSEWLKLDGDSGPYIQYVCARINSLVSKVEVNKDMALEYNSENEHKLIGLLNSFNDVVENAQKQYKTSLICSYLYDLSKAFNQFYANCPIANAQTPEIKNARAILAADVLKVLEQGLNLLGIQAPSRM